MGLGPRSQRWLLDIGIAVPEHLNAQDPIAVHARCKAAQSRVSLNLPYALIGAVEQRDWRDVARSGRTRILLRLQDMGLIEP